MLFVILPDEFLLTIKKPPVKLQSPWGVFLSPPTTWRCSVPKQHGFVTPFYKGQRHQQVQLPYPYPQWSYQSSLFQKRKCTSRLGSESQQALLLREQTQQPPKFWQSIPVLVEPPSFRQIMAKMLASPPPPNALLAFYFPNWDGSLMMFYG